jgi:hypothetical protein
MLFSAAAPGGSSRNRRSSRSQAVKSKSRAAAKVKNNRYRTIRDGIALSLTKAIQAMTRHERPECRRCPV